VISKVYLCHRLNSMPKDTKTLGYIKAPACESRGFVNITRGCVVLTHPLFLLTAKSQWLRVDVGLRVNAFDLTQKAQKYTEFYL
ncbi:MAG: hypothetical protein IKY84_00235, partial [Bacteroidaceae bacterium]|nr:hypothetical protein [Bacteroidaceae bacterium]